MKQKRYLIIRFIGIVLFAICSRNTAIAQSWAITGNTGITATNYLNNIKTPGTALEQNVPNPLNGNASIRYTIPVGAKNASLFITDANGKSIKQIPLNEEGLGIVNMEASTFSTGVYSYTLIIDGKRIDTKKMMITR